MAFRTLLLSAAALTAICATSCTKEYTCQCTITYSGAPGLPAPQVKEYPVRDTKTKAQNLCRENSNTTTKDGITADEDCTLY